MTLLAADAIEVDSSDTQLVVAALLGIAAVVVLITWLKVHPFLALVLGAAVLGTVGGWPPRTPSPASRAASGRPWAASGCSSPSAR